MIARLYGLMDDYCLCAAFELESWKWFLGDPVDEFDRPDARRLLSELAVDAQNLLRMRDLVDSVGILPPCVFRPCRSAIPAEADHLFRPRRSPERCAAGWFYFAGFWFLVKSPLVLRMDSPPSLMR